MRRGKSYNPNSLPITPGKITIKTMNSTLPESVIGQQQSRTGTLPGKRKAVAGTSLLTGHPLFFYCFLSDEIRNALFKTMSLNSYAEQICAKADDLPGLLCNQSCHFDYTGREAANLSHADCYDYS